MPKYTWTIAGGITGLLIIGFLGWQLWLHRQALAQRGGLLSQSSNAVQLLQTELASVQQAALDHAEMITNLQSDLVGRSATIQALQEEKEKFTRAQQDLENQMRSALQSKDITISELQGKLTVNILDRVLFDSGEAVLKPEGEAVLMKIADVLAQYPKRQIHVIGHTDNIPIRASARDRFPSNWELSTARATAAVRFLQEQAAVDPQQLGAVGYGEFQPVADNSTTEGRAKNRRIAVVVLPEIFVPPESEVLKTEPSTESPPPPLPLLPLAPAP